MKSPELVSPAGGLEKLQIVLEYGADAVYLGTKNFNLRAQSSNFQETELNEAVGLAHGLGKRVYVTLNSLIRNKDIPNVIDTIKSLEQSKVDAVIVSDLGVLDLVKTNSNVPVHISTQSSVCNWQSAKLLHSLGVKRIVLARELSLAEIAEIKQKVPELELEIFVHGAMCMAYSGRCNLSMYLASRSANEGFCTHSCRWKYHLMEEKRPGEYLPVFEDESGSFIYSSKDLCTIEFLDKVIETGVDSVKIEGRMKGLLYAATTTKAYREAIDSCSNSQEYAYNPEWRQELETYTYRGYTSGFLLDGTLDDGTRFADIGYDRKYELVAKVVEKLSSNEYIIEIRNRLVSYTDVEVITSLKGLGKRKFKMPLMEDISSNQTMEIANPSALVKIKVEDVDLKPLDLIRQEIG